MNRCKHRGFAIIEMFAVLMLLTAFSLVAARVFSQSVRQLRDVPQAASEISAIEQIREMLGRDTWNAVEIRIPSDDLVLLVDAKGELVTWQRLSDQRFSRTTLSETNIWSDVEKLEFKNTETGVKLSQRARGWTFICPVKLAARQS